MTSPSQITLLDLLLWYKRMNPPHHWKLIASAELSDIPEKRMSVGACWAFTMFWVLLISLYSKQPDKVLAAGSQSVGQLLHPSVCEASKHTHSIWSCRGSPLPVFIFTSGVEESDTGLLLLWHATDDDSSLVTKQDFGNDFAFPANYTAAPWMRAVGEIPFCFLHLDEFII